jgi:hypothetical protein
LSLPTLSRRREGSDPTSGGAPVRSTVRAALAERTFRADRWWLAPLITVLVLGAFTVYGTWAALRPGGVHFDDPYLSPFYSPCLTDRCEDHYTPHLLGDGLGLSPGVFILVFPLGFRLTCYYYRKAYYRAFMWSPPACAIPDARKTYRGETRFPLVLQNIHRYFFYFAVPFALILSYDAVRAFFFPDGFGIGVGTVVLLANAALIWLYTLSCHSCRHLCGGGLKQFSRAPRRFRLWQRLSRLNSRHMLYAWASLVWIALTDFYIWLVATDRLTDYHFAF